MTLLEQLKRLAESPENTQPVIEILLAANRKIVELQKDVALASKERDELRRQNAELVAALRGWVHYFQSDVPDSADKQAEQAEVFTRCWYAMEKALAVQPKET